MSGGRWKMLGATRLAQYDYSSPGPYFVTICAHQRQALFTSPDVERTIEEVWTAIPKHFPGVELDAFVVMPNHVHGILEFVESSDPAGAVASQHAGKLLRRASLSVVMRSFKAAVTRDLRIRALHGDSPIWQPNYYDRVIRNDAELNRIREYIAQNPVAWSHDHENPLRVADDAYDRVWSWLERS